MRTRFQLKETIVTIIGDGKYHEMAREEIRKQRSELERYIRKDPFFKITYEPYDCHNHGPAIVKRMVDVSKKVGTGPMAAVAGIISEFAVKAMVSAGATYAMVDNGGDIAMYIDKPINVGIFAGESSIKDLALRIEPRDGILGVCTSSATVGHSVSLGHADAAVVISEDVALADAGATALGNAVKDTSQEGIGRSFSVLKDVDGIEGAIVIAADNIGLWGKVQRLIRAKINLDYITRG